MKRALLFLIVFVLLSGTMAKAESFLEVRFLDVGTADAALLLCDGHAMLIDGGNKSDSSFLYSVLKGDEIQTLDIVVATHAHVDHIGGIPGALNYAFANLVLCPVTSYSSDAFSDLKKYANGITVPSVGDTYALGSAVVTILALNSGATVNESSIVLKVQHGNISFLFTADAEGETEQFLLDSSCDLSATVLKVAHHGSDTSSSTPFLRAVSPTYAVISVSADSSDGSPANIVLENLQNIGSEIYRTDLHGDITFISDGNRIFVATESAYTPVFSEPQTADVSYILNTNTEKFHEPDCKHVREIKEKNKREFQGTREEAIAQGFVPCKVCNP